MRKAVLAVALVTAVCSGNSAALNEGWTRASVTPASLSGGLTGALVGDIILREKATEDI
jgi:hypothetical protein